MVMGSLTTGAFHAASSAYHGSSARAVMDSAPESRSTIRSASGRARFAGESPARDSRRAALNLIRDGKLVGLLSNFYDTHRLLTDEHRAEKLGASAAAKLDFPPLSGYRLGEGGGRRFDRESRLRGHQRLMRASGGVAERELIARGRRRNLRRAHLVHLSDQRPARGRLHLHRQRRFVHYSRRQTRRAARAQLPAHQCEYRAGFRASARPRRAPDEPRQCGARRRPTTCRRSPLDSIELAEVGAT